MTSTAADLDRRSSFLSPSLRGALHLAGTLFTVALVLGWIFFLRPQTLGGPAAYVMVFGESMEPTYEPGDFVVASARDSYEVGDVIVYRVPEGSSGAGRLIIYRVIGGDEESGFRTQGDNREPPDQWRPTESDIVGKLWFHIPNAGGVLPYLRSPLTLATFFGVLTFLLIFLKQDDKGQTSEEGSSGPLPEKPATPRTVSRRRRPKVLSFILLGAGLAALLAGYLAGGRTRSERLATRVGVLQSALAGLVIFHAPPALRSLLTTGQPSFMRPVWAR